MKLFDFFKKDKPSEKVEEVVVEEENQSDLICNYCEKSIYGEQRIKTFDGKKYHLKPCWYKLRKDAVKLSKGY